MRLPAGHEVEAAVDIDLHLLYANATGIDVEEAKHWIAVPPDRGAQPVHRFGSFSAEVHELANWLISCGVTTVSMESTGIYWIALFELLESRGLAVVLIDPRQAKRAPGRPKTDVLDCQWLQPLHTYGLLLGAFCPEEQVCVLRVYVRHRQILMSRAAEHI